MYGSNADARSAVALCLAMAMVEVLLASSASLAQDSASPSKVVPSHLRARGARKPALDPSAPPVTRRLWNDLRCTCGECDPMALADCSCDYAKSERDKIAAEVLSLGPKAGTPEDAVYAAVVKKYVARHGPDAVLAPARRQMLLRRAFIGMVGIAVLVGLFALVERLRSPQRPPPSSRGARRKRASR